MENKKIKKKAKVKFFADLSFNISQDEVWEELSSHNEQKANTIPIKFHILKSISEIGTFLNTKKCIQFPLF